MLLFLYISIATEKYISRDGILDYLQALCVEISQRTRRTDPDWCGPAPDERPVPSIAHRAPLGPPQHRFCTEVGNIFQQ